MAEIYKDYYISLLKKVFYHTPRLLSRNLRHYVNLPSTVLITLLIVTLVSLAKIQSIQLSLDSIKLSPTSLKPIRSQRKPTHSETNTLRQAWIRADHMETGYLDHVTSVLRSLKFSLDGGTYSDWDLLWSHNYPFMDNKLKPVLSSLKPHQKVNKLPGSGFVTSKVSLATSVLQHVPKAFRLPVQEMEFKRYAEDNPHTMWVQKSNNHRGIHIKPVSGLDLSTPNTFVQQYIDKPLIIDKRKFDIGIYTIVTSLDPLRIYYVSHEILLRFCAHDYYPFASNDRDKYVVTDDYTPIWEIPSLNKYYSKGFTAKESFCVYLSEKGFSPDRVFDGIESTIREVYLSKLLEIRKAADSFNPRNFFEMVRFDFVLDDRADLYLMEVNMSPNLSSQHFKPNQVLYEQVLYNLFHLIGLAGSIDHPARQQPNELDMVVGPRSISASTKNCVTHCTDGCLAEECHLCAPCMTVEERLVYEDAYREHTNRRNTKRVFPPSLDAKKLDIKPHYWASLPLVDQQMHSWFVEKCRADKSWC